MKKIVARKQKYIFSVLPKICVCICVISFFYMHKFLYRLDAGKKIYNLDSNWSTPYYYASAASSNNPNCLPLPQIPLPDYASAACTNETCGGLTCGSFLLKPQDTSSSAFKHLDSIQRPESTVDYAKQTGNCTAYRIDRGFVTAPLDQSSSHQPRLTIAFNLIVHKDVEQVEVLLRAIYRPWNVYCVHVDEKAEQKFKDDMNSIIKCLPNVFIASKLERVTWAGFRRLQADITCMKDNLQRDVKWSYLLNTAGQAFPIKTVEQMERILTIYNGANDIEGIYGARIHRSRFQKEWRETDGKVEDTKRTNPPPPHNIDIVRGSAYGVFSRGFVEFVIGDVRARDLLNWSRNTWSPDEHYWATLHHAHSNPHLKAPGSYSGEPGSKPWLAVYANWGEKKCYGHIVRGVCVFGVNDLHQLIGRKEFFVNKFYRTVQPLALDCIDAWLRNAERCGYSIDEDFYRKLPFIKPP